MFSGATTHVQDAPVERACHGKLNKDRLRTADVSRRGPVIRSIEIQTRGPSLPEQ
jgi:hypothetical protein